MGDFFDNLPNAEHPLLSDLPRGIQGKHDYATARFADPARVQQYAGYEPGQILFGAIDTTLLGFPGQVDRHIFTVAASRSGKFTGGVAPALCHYAGSVIGFDPKGEISRILGGRRGKGTTSGGPGLGQDVFYLDPFGITGKLAATFNPFDMIPNDPDHPAYKFIVDDALLIAESLIPDTPGSQNDHWVETARDLFKGLALFVLTYEDPAYGERSIIKVKDILSTSVTYGRLRAILEEMSKFEVKDSAHVAMLCRDHCLPRKKRPGDDRRAKHATTQFIDARQ